MHLPPGKSDAFRPRRTDVTYSLAARAAAAGLQFPPLRTKLVCNPAGSENTNPKRKRGTTMASYRILFASAAIAFLFGTEANAAEPLKAGVAVVDITPPPGYRMAGY